MRSPFPGMDPFLEMYWRDVHTRLTVYAVDAIQSQLPGDLWAQVEEGVTIDLGDDVRAAGPDVRVIEQSTEPPGFDGGATGTASVAVAEPVLVPVALPQTERHIVILDTTAGNRVVTAIEFLSPTNKIPGLGRDRYRRKQEDYLTGGVNLVEVDLVRDGRFTLAVPPEGISQAHRAPYMACVRRVMRPTEAEIYPIPLRERLPAIPIPLRPHDRDAILDLQALIDQVYTQGRYIRIDYARDPEPPFGPVDARWVDELLQAAGRRPRPNGAESSEGS